MKDRNVILSIVIPTKGREEVLAKCIDHLVRQSLPVNCYEILIVDDGEDGGARETMRDIKLKGSCVVRYLQGPGRGVGAARNLGVQRARSEIILIIGSDIIASPYFLTQHLRFHERFSDSNCAVLGQTKLYPEATKSPFMQIWGDLPYWEIAGRIEVPCWYFFTGNISFKKGFFMRYGMFDEDFRRIGFEDVEVGFRLSKHGLRIMYNKEAVAYHHHAYTFEEACRQQMNHGYNFGILAEKLKMLDCAEHLPVLAERYGIIGWHHTFKGFIKNVIKKRVLHRKLIMNLLEKGLKSKTNSGRISVLLYPKVFSYYTNQGLLLYKKEHNLS